MPSTRLKSRFPISTDTVISTAGGPCGHPLFNCLDMDFMKRFVLIPAVLFLAFACSGGEDDVPSAKVLRALVDGIGAADGSIGGIRTEGAVISLVFTMPLDITGIDREKISFTGGEVELSLSDAKTLTAVVKEPLEPLKRYSFTVAAGRQLGIMLDKDYELTLYTGPDTTPKFPEISDEQLLTLVQEKTFSYFWDYAHPSCGLARERLGSGNTVTAGGSGFGIMTIPMAVERGFITRAESAARMRTIVEFLEGADRFHGAWPHWLDGNTGKVIPFSATDNGGDLVETAFLIQGLLTAAQYFDRTDEADIRDGIKSLWETVEWDWYTRGGQKVLYWHWSPNQGWVKDMQIKGWNEALIVYVLGAASPTHPISREVYDQGWASGGAMTPGMAGPLFFAHYSFLGLDPRNLKDAYADYWQQNVAQALYNYQYCVRNSRRHAGYGEACWGLTASDYPKGYTASSPSNDKGTIAPTAALASFPYTPEESLKALRYFYYVLGDRLWGTYGFKDAFCLDVCWFANSYIAIDQGPIAVMIENYRTGLLWDLFMRDTDVQSGLDKLGFSY